MNPEPISNVQLYSHTARELKQTQQHKILKFIEHNCIEYDQTKKVFICKHIDGYNKTDYTLSKVGGEWTCDCQHYVTAKKHGEENPYCSHIGAVLESLKRKHNRRREEAIRMTLENWSEGVVL